MKWKAEARLYVRPADAEQQDETNAVLLARSTDRTIVLGVCHQLLAEVEARMTAMHGHDDILEAMCLGEFEALTRVLQAIEKADGPQIVAVPRSGVPA